MTRPSLLQAIFQQPSQSYVVREDAYAEPNISVWRASFPFAHKDKPTLKHRPLSLDVPTLPLEGPPSPSPSPTPPLLSPASTPKSSTPSFTDETSDSSADPEFETPPDSPQPSLEDMPQHTETLSPGSSVKQPAMTSTTSSTNSLFNSQSARDSSPKRQVRQTPLSGVPDWAKDVRWLVGHQPAAKRAVLSALADPNYRPTDHVRANTAPARHSSYIPQSADQFGMYVVPPRPSGRKRKSRAMTEGRRSGYRMSALVEVSETEEAGEVTAEGIVRKRSTSTQRARPRPRSVRSSSSTSSSRTVLALQDTPGYGSIALSRAYTPAIAPPTLDLTKGAAQTTMASLSVVRVGPSSRMRRISLSISLNGSASSLSGLSSRNASLSSLGSRSMLGLGSSASIPLAARLAEIEGALGLTAHMPPSRKISSSQVLVQVHAVALDALDAIILSKRLAKGGYGFVPGRSFVGRAVECGFEVANVSRGDWVIGLTEIRKCGALSELVVIDKSRVCTIPRPTDRLTTTQCALLPLCGVPAHRAVRTIPNSATKTGPDGKRRPTRVLVLQAHDGAGLCAVQVMRQLGMRVTAQVPVGSENVGFGTGPSLALKVRGRTRAGKGREFEPPTSSKRMEEVEVVVGDDPVEVIGKLEEGVYDAVIDTVGGRGVWDACRRVMCADAHFTTLVGDSTDSVPSINAHVRSSFRSLARAWARRDKGLGYQWVSPASDLDHEGEDVRHSLNAVAEAAAHAAYGAPSHSDEHAIEGILPRVACSFPLDRAQEAFAVDEDGRGPLIRGGTVVVRIL
ncbi:alcohol dehydrogenase groES-like domain protein, putative [Rhizoctonia solani AG-3 Rhs1AP]|uniref:Alcohol dehydrogenase groES-like domain protein, putative n=1 Tax=Rhizoctonia solani AG-3 Rhs1AP TaxID=1086054 RepID=X8JF47_9AGAM|nr:alcohol dehydrogenase groES-like domain protein, putative [Rhizoctonia solani AG-3 Rhs1AP]